MFKKIIFSFLSLLIIGTSFFSYQPVQAGQGGTGICILYPQNPGCGVSPLKIVGFYALKTSVSGVADPYAHDKNDATPAIPTYGNSPFPVRYEIDLDGYNATKAYTVYIYCDLNTPITDTSTPAVNKNGRSNTNVTPPTGLVTTANDSAGFTLTIPANSKGSNTYTTSPAFITTAYPGVNICNYNNVSASDYVLDTANPTNPTKNIFYPKLIVTGPLNTVASKITDTNQTVLTRQDTLALSYSGTTPTDTSSLYSGSTVSYAIMPAVYVYNPKNPQNTNSIYRLSNSAGTARVNYTATPFTSCGTPSSDIGNTTLTPPAASALYNANPLFTVSCQYFNNSPLNDPKKKVTFGNANTVSGTVQNSTTASTGSAQLVTVIPDKVIITASSSTAAGNAFTVIPLSFSVDSISSGTTLKYVLDCGNGSPEYSTPPFNSDPAYLAPVISVNPGAINNLAINSTKTNLPCRYSGQDRGNPILYTATITAFRGNVTANFPLNTASVTIKVSDPVFTACAAFTVTSCSTTSGNAVTTATGSVDPSTHVATPTFKALVSEDDFFGPGLGSIRTFTVICDINASNSPTFTSSATTANPVFDIANGKGSATFNQCKYPNYTTNTTLTYHPRIIIKEENPNGSYQRPLTSDLTYKVSPPQLFTPNPVFNYGAGNREF